MLHSVPQDMDEVRRIVAAGNDGDEAAVIVAGLQNWAQELLDEGTEGSYFTAKIDQNIMHITDVNGVEVATPTLAGQTYVEAFRNNARGVLLQIQNDLRKRIDGHQIKL